jgi:hypothetical protein
MTMTSGRQIKRNFIPQPGDDDTDIIRRTVIPYHRYDNDHDIEGFDANFAHMSLEFRAALAAAPKGIGEENATTTGFLSAHRGAAQTDHIFRAIGRTTGLSPDERQSLRKELGTLSPQLISALDVLVDMAMRNRSHDD